MEGGAFEFDDENSFEEEFNKIFMTEEGKRLEEELFKNIIALDFDGKENPNELN